MSALVKNNRHAGLPKKTNSSFLVTPHRSAGSAKGGKVKGKGVAKMPHPSNDSESAQQAAKLKRKSGVAKMPYPIGKVSKQAAEKVFQMAKSPDGIKSRLTKGKPGTGKGTQKIADPSNDGKSAQQAAKLKLKSGRVKMPYPMHDGKARPTGSRKSMRNGEIAKTHKKPSNQGSLPKKAEPPFLVTNKGKQ